MKAARTLLTLAAASLLFACATQEEPKPAPAPEPQAAPAPAARPAAPSAPAAQPAPAAAAKPAAPVQRSVYFDFDKSDVRPEFRSLLEANANYLRQNPSLKVRVEGNCDERGSREYNVALGQRRAESVMKTLVLLGVDAKRIEPVSFGEEKPRCTQHDETCWAQNRRGDISY